MQTINQFVSVNTNLSRSVNIERDANNQQTLDSYVLTNNANQALNEVVSVCLNNKNSNKSFSIVGPYGSGKSSFILYLSHLLSNNNKAIQKLPTPLKKSIKTHLKQSLGYCQILLSGSPEPFAPIFLQTLKSSLIPYYRQLGISSNKTKHAIDELLSLEIISIKKIINLVKKIRLEIENSGGRGLLIVVDEFGKFLEYAARHESDDIFLLQVLAEEAYNTSSTNILLFVLLHQSFEQYGKHLDNQLKNEWIKIQGRYQTLSFVDNTAELLPIIAQVFQPKLPAKVKQKITTQIKDITQQLKQQKILPHTLKESTANDLFLKCYPLHPLTILLLPILCQKIAQNERTLFNYLGSNEPHSLIDFMNNIKIGAFIYPNALYDYFMNGENLSNNFLTIRALSEAYTALEKAIDATQLEINLLKTIALFNIANSHIVASKTVLSLCDKNYQKNADKLSEKSIITYRKFNGEYRIWQGSDFDLNQSITEQKAQLTTLNIAEYLNNEQVFLPFVAKRYSIEQHSLFYFQPIFINANQYTKIDKQTDKPRVIFCLNFNQKDKALFKSHIINYFSQQDICVLINNSKDIKIASKNRIALENIAAQNPIIAQDPVINREFTQYLIDAKSKEKMQFEQILHNPKECLWFNQKQPKKCHNKREVQHLFSNVLESVYPDSPIIKNELINRNNPSSQANSGRKKLLLHLLEHHNKKDLAIDKYPAEKSMYLAIFEESGIHKNINNKWTIQQPTDTKYLKIWQEINNFFKQAINQASNLSALDNILTAPPFGVKKPVLPIFYIANYLYNKDEIAVYEDRFYVPYFTPEHLERFLKRPDTFGFQQFEIKGFNQSLMQEYESSLLDKKAPNAPAIFSAINSFIKELPPYTQQTSNISNTAQAVRDAFKNNKSPQDLLFRKLPEACGLKDNETNGFGETLKQALQEIKNAYSIMINKQIGILAEKLDIERLEKNKGKIKTKLVEYGQTLQAYTMDKETTKFIKTIGNGYGDIANYFERVLMSMHKNHPKEWNDIDSDFVRQKLSENIKLIINLDKIHKYHTKDELSFDENSTVADIHNQYTHKAQIRIINELIKKLSDIKEENKYLVNND